MVVHGHRVGAGVHAPVPAAAGGGGYRGMEPSGTGQQRITHGAVPRGKGSGSPPQSVAA